MENGSKWLYSQITAGSIWHALRIEKSILSCGCIISVGSGVVVLQGFFQAFVGELFCVLGSTSNSKSSNRSYGIVINLSRDDSIKIEIGGILLNPSSHCISSGSKVEGISWLASLVLGDFAIGSILDPIGIIILNLTSNQITAKSLWLIENVAPSIIARQSVDEPLQTGILCIDALIPIGRGQRQLVVGDRQTGKTSIGLDTILNQGYEKVFCVYLPIGAKASSIFDILNLLVTKDALFYTILLCATAASSPLVIYLSVYTGDALSEFFMYLRELPTFLMLDGLSKHSMAYREIYLLLGRPPGREAYPGEIFFVHSRLLERSAKLNQTLGGGSMTAFPVIETLAQDVSAYITTNVISITDGQIFLSSAIFLSGTKPAIDLGLSVSRVGSTAQWQRIKVIGSNYKLELGQCRELTSIFIIRSGLRLRNIGKIEERVKTCRNAKTEYVMTN